LSAEPIAAAIVSAVAPRDTAGSPRDLRARGRGRPGAAPQTAGGEHERREQEALQALAEERRVRLLVVGAREQGEIEQVARHAPPGHPPGLGHGDHLGEHLLHRQGRANLHADPRVALAEVGEPVPNAGLDLDHRARAGVDRAPADAKPHLALDDLEALRLDRMHVLHRHSAAGSQAELEREQLAAGGRRGLDELEALARHRVLERLSWCDHGALLGLGHYLTSSFRSHTTTVYG